MHNAAMSPEFQLLAASCASQTTTPDGALALQALAGAGVDWSQFLHLVKRHRVAGLVFTALQPAKVDMPAEAARALAMAALNIRRQNAAAAAETVALQQVFDGAAIPVRFFKGAALAQEVFGSLEIKHSKDIDFLVPPDQAKAAVELMTRRGYQLWLPFPRITDRQWPLLLRFNREVAMVEPVSHLQVEPHWRLAMNGGLLQHLDANAPEAQVELPGYGWVRTFRHDDHFAYLCFHGSENGWVRLKWLADIQALLADLPAARVEALFRHAESIGVGPSAALTLALCQRLFGLAIPPALAGELRRTWALRYLERRALARLADPSDHEPWLEIVPRLLLLAWFHGCLGSQLILTLMPAHYAMIIPLPRALHWLYAAGRLPFGLISRLLGRHRPPPYPTASSLTAPPTTRSTRSQ